VRVSHQLSPEQLAAFCVASRARPVSPEPDVRSDKVELWLQPPRFTPEVTERPVASSLARLQAEAGGTVTNLRHEVVRLGEAERQALRLLDGGRDRAGLHAGLLDLVARGVLVVKENGQPVVADLARVSDLVNTILSNTLSRLAREALLVG
jgi:hypothetical protein